MSYDAIDLISELLREKEHRLCSKSYRKNDHPKMRHEPTGIVSRVASEDLVRFVYSDDASEIKKHRFFDRIAWDRQHLTRPPFVPDVVSNDDTRYFDEEEPISDLDRHSSSCDKGASASNLSIDADKLASNQGVGGDGQQEGLNTTAIAHPAACLQDKPKKQGKARKRPRDKVLRDKDVGRQALDIRKWGAFIGYTYRRPKVLFSNELSL